MLYLLCIENREDAYNNPFNTDDIKMALKQMIIDDVISDYRCLFNNNFAIIANDDFDTNKFVLKLQIALKNDRFDAIIAALLPGCKINGYLMHEEWEYINEEIHKTKERLMASIKEIKDAPSGFIDGSTK